ncbi:PspC domain-containing protein [Acetobacterium sp.]|uniref:PspC domain-containing protein n=1 Tax=Acetobacterium sp. TaxID=1872094 RepID=UPI003593D656
MMKKQLMKSKKRAIVAGVCAGLGEYCNISPWVFRGLLLVLPIVLRTFGLMISVGIYIFLAVVLPGNRRIADQDVVEVDYEIIDDNNEEEIIDFSDEKTGTEEKVD